MSQQFAVFWGVSTDLSRTGGVTAHVLLIIISQAKSSLTTIRGKKYKLGSFVLFYAYSRHFLILLQKGIFFFLSHPAEQWVLICIFLSTPGYQLLQIHKSSASVHLEIPSRRHWQRAESHFHFYFLSPLICFVFTGCSGCSGLEFPGSRSWNSLVPEPQKPHLIHLGAKLS